MIVTLLTDYGLGDEFVGVLHGVIRRILPGAQIIDITHAIRRHEVRHGAIALRAALPYMPVGVHVAVVDPQVGTERRALALRCDDGRILVGPDNGLLSLAWQASGGALAAVDISRSEHRLEPLSATFHGRDLFAPVAAQLAAGAELADAGEPVALDELMVLELPVARIEGDAAMAHVLTVDGYGNIGLNLSHADLLSFGLAIGARVQVTSRMARLPATLVQTFADVPAGDALLYEDAFGAVAVAVNRGEASAALAVAADSELRISRA